MVEWIKASDKEPPMLEELLVVIDGHIYYMTLSSGLRDMVTHWARVEAPEE